MGATSFYGLPYPDPGSTVDVPRDVKALADKLELWKNGFTVPTGNIVAGGTGTNQQWVEAQFSNGGKLVGVRMVPAAVANPIQIAGYHDGVRTCYFQVSEDGQVIVHDGATARQLPFATQVGQNSIPITASVAGSVTFTLKTGLFLTTPYLIATPYTSSGNHDDIYSVRAWGGSTTGYTLGCQQVAGVNWTAAMPISWIAIQMLSTGTAGPTMRALDDGGNHPQKTVACHTPDCDAEDEPITLYVPETSGRVECGTCGQPIEDVKSVNTKSK